MSTSIDAPLGTAIVTNKTMKSEGGAVKFALAIVMTLSLSGCSQDSAQQPLTAPPTAPIPSASQAGLFGWVVDDGGACIVGATVEVTRGQSVGQTITQTATPCYMSGDSPAFELDNLTPGVALTLRASGRLEHV